MTSETEAGIDISGYSIAQIRELTSGEAKLPEAKTEPETSEGAAEAATESIAAESDTAQTKDAKSTTEETPEKKVTGGFQKRIDKLTEKNRGYEAEIARLKAIQPAAKQEIATPAPTATNAPKQEDFSTWEEFSDALVEYKVGLLDAKKSKAESDRVAQAAQAESESRWDRQTTAAAGKHEDFDVVALSKDLPVSPVMFHVIQSSDNGAELLYHLGSNPEVSAKIAAMSPGAAALALGRLEAKLFPDEAPKPAAVAPVKALPKPVSTVGGGVATAKASLNDDMPFSEFKEMLAKQLKRK